MFLNKLVISEGIKLSIYFLRIYHKANPLSCIYATFFLHGVIVNHRITLEKLTLHNYIDKTSLF